MGTYLTGDAGNNNHLFRHNHKKTFSVPQPLSHPPPKLLAAGYDFMIMAGNHSERSKQQVWCFHQNALYRLKSLEVGGLRDLATSDNIVGGVSEKGQAWVWEFNPATLTNDSKGPLIRPMVVDTPSSISRLHMREGEVFLVGQEGQVYHLQRNEWYQQSTYS